jgi:hypothetical protein
VNIRPHHVRGATSVALDPAVPFVAEILDEDRLLEELARAFPERAFTEPTDVLDISYIPRHGLSATFEVTESGAPRVVAVRHATDVPAGGNAPSNGAATDVRSLDGWGAVAWEYPADPALPSLVRLTDTSAMSGVLRWLGGATSDACGCAMLRYTAGESCVIRIVGHTVDVVARHASRGRTADSHARLRWLWEHPDRAFRMAEPLGYDDRLHTRFERMVPGEPSDTLARPAQSVPMQALTRQIGYVHALDVGRAQGLRRFGVGAVIGRLERTAARRLGAAFPSSRELVTDCVTSLRSAAADLPAADEVLLHGDLDSGNVILGDDGPTLIGLEHGTVGHPEFDLALLATSYVAGALQLRGSVDGAVAVIDELPELYGEATGTIVRGDTYAWYVAATLVGWQANAVLTTLAPQTDGTVDTLLAMATGVLREGARSEVMRAFAD